MTTRDDAGLTFYATIETADAKELHRDTPDRAELLEWMAVQRSRPGARVVTLGMAATSDAAIKHMLAAIVFGGLADPAPGAKVDPKNPQNVLATELATELATDDPDRGDGFA